MREQIDIIYADDTVRDSATARRVIAAYPNARVVWCDPSQRESLGASLDHSPRRALYLKHHKGSFLKTFPRHPWYEGGGGVYYNLIIGYNCYGSCQYCFIQTIFHDALPTMYVNADDMTRELRAFLENDPSAWISTGEYIDSLQIDAATRYTERVMDVMQDFPRATLELRTKSGRVDHLPANPRAKVCVAYSISPRAVVERVEPSTASLQRRLEKARALYEKGYAIDVRIDPIIATPRFADDYRQLPDEIERVLGFDCVQRMFLGVLRFDDDLLKHMASSNAARHMLAAEYVRCPDGRYRPSRHARTAIYRDIVRAARRHRADLDITIMMEPGYVQATALAG